MWSLPENVSRAFEKSACPAVAGWRALYVSVRFDDCQCCSSPSFPFRVFRVFRVPVTESRV